MARKINALLGIGPAAGGKSSILKLIQLLISRKGSNALIIRVESSEIIRWGAAQNGKIGQQVREHMHLSSAGLYLPDAVMNPLVKAWTDLTLHQHPQAQLLLGAGFPRTEGQGPMLECFEKFAIINKTANKDQSLTAIQERLRKSQVAGEEVRSDDSGGGDVALQRWQEHEKHTAAVVKKHKGRVVHLDRQQTLAEQLQHALEFLVQLDDLSPVPMHVVYKAMSRLGTRTHEIHAEIAKIEGPSKNERPTVAQPSHHTQTPFHTRAVLGSEVTGAAVFA